MERMRVVRLKSPYTVSGLIKGDTMKKLIVLVLCFLLIAAPALAAAPLGNAPFVPGEYVFREGQNPPLPPCGVPIYPPLLMPGMIVCFTITIENDGDAAYNTWIRFDGPFFPINGDTSCVLVQPWNGDPSYVMCDLGTMPPGTFQVSVYVTIWPEGMNQFTITGGSDNYGDPMHLDGGVWIGPPPAYSFYLPVFTK